MISQTEIENFYPSLEEFSEETQALLNKFHHSREVFKLTQSLIEVAIAGIDLWEIESIITGKYFEEIAGLYVQSKLQTKNIFITTPSETDWIYQKFYADIHTYLLYNFQTMISGITIPDGLIFQKGKVYLQLAGICEYTAKNNFTQSTQKQAQLEHYLKPEFVANDLGMSEIDCIRNAPEYGQRLRELLSYVRPDIPHLPISLKNSNSWRIIYALPATSDGKRNSLPHIPINNRELRYYTTQLIDQITSEYQSEYQLFGIS